MTRFLFAILLTLSSCSHPRPETVPTFPFAGSAGVASQLPVIPTRFFPSDNIWNTDITHAPVHPSSATWIAKITERGNGQPYSDSYCWCGWAYPNYGMPYAIVDINTPRVSVAIVGQNPIDSDLIPYPFTSTTPIEAGTADKHAFMISGDSLYEFYFADWNNSSPTARATVAWATNSDTLRPDSRSSADEAGLPLFPGVVRLDEVESGTINHALRFELATDHIDGTRHLWPARHTGGTGGSNCPPMGARIRLKASYDISTFSPQTQVVLRALQHYGAFLADIGEPTLDMQGTLDPDWVGNPLIGDLFHVPVDQFEFIDESGMMADPNSGRVKQAPPNKPPPRFQPRLP